MPRVSAHILVAAVWIWSHAPGVLLAQTVDDDALPANPNTNYSLFNPTPRDQRRPMDTDRPGFSDSPFSIDAGVIQLETSLLQYTRNTSGDTTETWSIGNSTTLKFGLLEDLELQLRFSPYTHQRTSTPAGTLTTDAISDLQLLAKLNLWGNDSATSGLAIFPFITIPTGSSLSTKEAEGGVAIPFAWNISDGLTFYTTIRPSLQYDDQRDDYDVELLTSFALYVSMTDELTGYVEYGGKAFWGDGTRYQPNFSTGLTYLLTPDVQLDIGAIFGFGGGADKVQAFVGLSIRH